MLLGYSITRTRPPIAFGGYSNKTRTPGQILQIVCAAAVRGAGRPGQGLFGYARLSSASTEGLPRGREAQPAGCPSGVSRQDSSSPGYS